MWRLAFKDDSSDSHEQIEKSEFVRLAIALGIGALGLRDSYTNFHCNRVFWISTKLLNHYVWHYIKTHEAGSEKLEQFFQECEDYAYARNDGGRQRIDGNLSYSGNKIVRHFESPLLFFACAVHDIGKIAWKDSLLLGGPVSADDNEARGAIEAHSENGVKLLHNTLSYLGVHINNKYNHWIYLVLFHHWGYNTDKRYPKDLHCSELRKFVNYDALPFLRMKDDSSQMDSNIMRVMIGIIRLADDLDARTSYRPYRSIPESNYEDPVWWKQNWNDVVGEITEKELHRFHPDVTYVFNMVQQSLRDTFFEYRSVLPQNISCYNKCFANRKCNMPADIS